MVFFFLAYFTLYTQSLSQGISAHSMELVALTRAQELSKVQRVNTYTDSKYAYLTLHTPAAVWRERQNSDRRTY